MCGIAGFVGAGDRDDLARMTAALIHRGPDGEGFHVDGEARVFLGQRRLAVIDIEGGEQPMWNNDETIGVIFNGEIYNHHELRRQLESKGHAFRSDHSDTEVLVHGYEEWGEDLTGRLNGMFAFAIFDKRERRLFLARDRMGKKPLFYADLGDTFVFASELSAVLVHPEVSKEADGAALRKFFAYNFLPAPHTPYRCIRKLPAGHVLSFDLGRRQARTRCYWRFRIEPADPPTAADLRRWPEELRHLLSEAVRRRLESDVPLGFLLSGGIDSSAVLCLAAGHLPAAKLEAFTIGFRESSFDESSIAAEVAKSIGAPHRVEWCDLAAMKQGINPLLARMDEPLGDSSLLPTSQLCRFARRHVTVALSGDGGDELFAGYDPFDALNPTVLFARMVPPPLRALMGRMAGLLPRSDSNMSLDFKARRWLRGARHAAPYWLPVWMGALDPGEIAELFAEPVDMEELYSEAVELWNDSATGNLIDRGLEFFTNLYLPDDILVKADRASMMHSLELRSPFLDADVVEFARRLPNTVKWRRGERKWLLKRALQGVVPSAVLDRKKKGFGIPLAAWLRRMDPPPLGGVAMLDESWLAERWADHRAGKGDYQHALWCWLALHHCFSNKVQA